MATNIFMYSGAPGTNKEAVKKYRKDSATVNEITIITRMIDLLRMECNSFAEKTGLGSLVTFPNSSRKSRELLFSIFFIPSL
jgi:hypothetical protein